MTDLLGVMESWTREATTVRSDDGSLAVIPLRHIVSGKPVPPRASPRSRVTAEEASRRANESWPALTTQPLGDWLLRASGGFSARANSVMACGDPGLPFDDALEKVHAFYAGHRLPSWAQLVVGSDVHAAFEAAGWDNARPGEADSLFQMASVASSVRAVRGLLPAEVPAIRHERTVSEEWLASDERAAAHREAAVGVLEGPAEVVLVSALPSESRDEHHSRPLTFRGRAAVTGDWVGITDVWVAPSHRRRGLAFVVLHALLDWAAERGGTTAYLQVRSDNGSALAAYARLGFATHHSYRYLTDPSPRRPPS